MITLEAFENTIDYILNKYTLDNYNSCHMSENNFNFFEHSKYKINKNIINLYPTTQIKIKFKLRYVYFDYKKYISDDKIDIFSGPRIAVINILTDNERTIADIIE